MPPPPPTFAAEEASGPPEELDPAKVLSNVKKLNFVAGEGEKEVRLITNPGSGVCCVAYMMVDACGMNCHV